MRFRTSFLAATSIAALLALPPAARAQYVGTANGPIPQTGATPGKIVTTSSTNCSVIKDSAAILFKLSGMAATPSTLNFVRLYDIATTPAPTTDVPKAIIQIPAGGTPLISDIPSAGDAFLVGLGICVTGTATATSNTAAVGGAIVNYSYK